MAVNFRQLITEDIENVLDLSIEILNDEPNLIEAIGFKVDLQKLTDLIFGDMDYNSDLFIGAFDGSNLIGMIFGITRPWKKGKETTGWIKFIEIKKNYRRKGIGTKLLNLIEYQLKKLNVTKIVFGSSSPNYILPGLLKSDSRSIKFFQKNKWLISSERISLKLDLQILNEENIKDILNELDNSKFELIDKVTEIFNSLLSFVENEFSYSWSLEVNNALYFKKIGICSILKLKENNEIIGFSAINGTNINWFGPIGVKKEFRKHGFGRLLLLHSVYKAKLMGFKELMFPWVNDSKLFYEKSLQFTKSIIFLKTERQLY